MAKDLSSQELQQWARVGAQARLAALAGERQAILQMFPDLAGEAPKPVGRTRGGRGRRRGPKARAAAKAPAPARQAKGRAKAPRAKAPKGRTPRMSAAARKAASERMTKYWAERRKAKEKEQEKAKEA